MLKFLYTGDYADKYENASEEICSTEDVTSEDSTDIIPRKRRRTSEKPDNRKAKDKKPYLDRAKWHLAIYTMGDKYLIPKLAEKAAMKFKDSLPNMWSGDLWPLVDEFARVATTNIMMQDALVDLWFQNDHSRHLGRDAKFMDKLKEFPTLELKFHRKHLAEVHAEMTKLREELVDKMRELDEIEERRLWYSN
ncbi:hypothetical protein ABW21_db0206955 [Orbilia brochopaga]|nr:hypothetical protein ABW21_db0206955 [Drechslerella brochopaga]